MQKKTPKPAKDGLKDIDDAEIDSSDACEENSSEDSSGQNLNKDEFDESTSECAPTQENIKYNKPCRSNSEVIDESGTPSPLRYGDRNVTEDCDVEKNTMKDAIIVGVFSLEAGAKYFKDFHGNLKKDKTYNATVGRNLKPVIVRQLSKNVDYTSVKKYDEAFADSLKKEPCHVVAVVEGSRSNFPRRFVAEDSQDEKYEYNLHAFHITGGDAVGRKDEKQSMNFYVREGMEKVFVFKKVEIPVKTQRFVAAEIVFSTEDGKKYGAVIVHIPNKFTNSQPECDLVHKALKEYAEKKHKEDNVMLACYVGDTNYKKVIQENSKPSFGGNQEGKSLSPSSSSAKKHTDFMQSVSLTKSPSVILNQPSTLNLVELNSSKKLTPVKTDHPSIQTTIQVDSKVVGKPKKKSLARRIGLFQDRKTKSEDVISGNKSTGLEKESQSLV